MSNSYVTPPQTDNVLGLHGENENIATLGNGVLQVNYDGATVVDTIDVRAHMSINRYMSIHPENSMRKDAREADQNAQSSEEGGISLRMIFEILQTEQAAIAQLQNQNCAPSRIELEPSQEIFHRAELVPKRSN